MVDGRWWFETQRASESSREWVAMEVRNGRVEKERGREAGFSQIIRGPKYRALVPLSLLLLKLSGSIKTTLHSVNDVFRLLRRRYATSRFNTSQAYI